MPPLQGGQRLFLLNRRSCLVEAFKDAVQGLACRGEAYTHSLTANFGERLPISPPYRRAAKNVQALQLFLSFEALDK